MLNQLLRFSRKYNFVPVSWAGGTPEQNYLNLGDALSPCIVAALSKKKIKRVSMRSNVLRLSSTGSILSNFVGGNVVAWGSGMSPTYNPTLKNHSGWLCPSETNIVPLCVRGPFTSHILEKGGIQNSFNCAYGDPVILLKKFYDPKNEDISKKHELGVILHLSETDGRELDARAFSETIRYNIPDQLSDSIHIINTLTDISSLGLKKKIDEILSCKRIVSTSFHGLLLAELYNIPCFYLKDCSGGPMKSRLTLENIDNIDTRFLDFFMSMNVGERYYYGQPKSQTTDWDKLIASIDKYWEPIDICDDGLIESFPLDLTPIQNLKKPSNDFFDHRIISSIPFQGSPREIAAFSKRLAKIIHKNMDA